MKKRKLESKSTRMSYVLTCLVCSTIYNVYFEYETALIDPIFGTFDRVVEECGIILDHNLGGYISIQRRCGQYVIIS